MGVMVIRAKIVNVNLNIYQSNINNQFFSVLRVKKNYKKDFKNELIKRFANTYEFCKGNINKFVLLLRKGVYPYDYMDGWEKFDETSLPDKKSILQQILSKRYY